MKINCYYYVRIKAIARGIVKSFILLASGVSRSISISRLAGRWTSLVSPAPREGRGVLVVAGWGGWTGGAPTESAAGVGFSPAPTQPGWPGKPMAARVKAAAGTAPQKIFLAATKKHSPDCCAGV